MQSFTVKLPSQNGRSFCDPRKTTHPQCLSSSPSLKLRWILSRSTKDRLSLRSFPADRGAQGGSRGPVHEERWKQWDAFGARVLFRALATALRTMARRIVFVLGGPGSGKGTNCTRLVEEFGVVHLSAGDLLRAHMKSGTPEGEMIADLIKQGKIVPSSVTVSLLQKAMEESGKDTFLIDGFPRNVENRDSFVQQTGCDCEFVLFFDCPETVLEKRLLGRNEGRADDNIETIKKRFRTFIESSMPVVELYEKLGKVCRVNSDQEREQVYEQAKLYFSERLQLSFASSK